MAEPIIAQFMLPITTKETVQELMQKGVDWGKTIGAIEELEKIKTEIEKEIEIKKKQGYSMEFFTGVCDCLMLIEDKLDELKGETE